MIAGYAVGISNDLASTARRFVKTTSRIEPRPKYHQYYNSYARAYIDLIKTQGGLFSKLARISKLPEPKQWLVFERRRNAG